MVFARSWATATDFKDFLHKDSVRCNLTNGPQTRGLIEQKNNMKMKFIIPLVVLCLAPGILSSAEVWQADMQISSIKITETNGELICRVTVLSNNDDDAREPSVRVLLPVGVKFVRASFPDANPKSTYSVSKSFVPDGSQGIVTWNIGENLTVGASRTIVIVTTSPPNGMSTTFGAFAWSITPDPNSANNFGSAHK
jgi:hypothetical protein